MNKLLVLGGSFQHIKVVEAAHRLGYKTYVTDNIEGSPAKKIADVALGYSVDSMDELISFCKSEGINGIINTSLDPCQIPYCRLCTALGLPCYGDQKQFEILTDKEKFKECCRKYGVDTIDCYDSDSVPDDAFPVMIKPVDGRGSRGQYICEKSCDLKNLISKAKEESRTDRVIVEKYLADAQDFTVAYLFVNGKAVLLRTGDRFTGDSGSGLKNIAIAVSSPSVYSDKYMDLANERVIDMLKGIGIQNGPVFFQGFIDGDTVRLYDPGFRFAGGEYERLFLKATGVDIIEILVRFSVTGIMCDIEKDDYYRINGMSAFHLDPTLATGKIGSISGLDVIKKNKYVETVNLRYSEGDIVEDYDDVRRRFAEICILAPNMEIGKETVRFVQENLKVISVDGENMLRNLFDIKRLENI